MNHKKQGRQQRREQQRKAQRAFEQEVGELGDAQDEHYGENEFTANLDNEMLTTDMDANFEVGAFEDLNEQNEYERQQKQRRKQQNQQRQQSDR